MMKILVCYQDHANAAFHKTIRITIPKTWHHTSIVNLMKQYVENYNKVFINQLSITDIHFALYLKDNITYIPIPSDGIISNYIHNHMKLFVRHNRHLYTKPTTTITKTSTTTSTRSSSPDQTRTKTNTTADGASSQTTPAAPAPTAATESVTATTALDVSTVVDSDTKYTIESSRANDSEVSDTSRATTTVMKIMNLTKEEEQSSSSSSGDDTKKVPLPQDEQQHNQQDTVQQSQQLQQLQHLEPQQQQQQQKVVDETLPQQQQNTTAEEDGITEETKLSSTQQQQQQDDSTSSLVVSEKNNHFFSSSPQPYIDHFRNILDWLGVPAHLYQNVVKDLEQELSPTPQEHRSQIVTKKLGSLLEASYQQAREDIHDNNDDNDSIVDPNILSTTVATMTSLRDDPTSSFFSSSHLKNVIEESDDDHHNIDDDEDDSAGEAYEVYLGDDNTMPSPTAALQQHLGMKPVMATPPCHPHTTIGHRYYGSSTSTSTRRVRSYLPTSSHDPHSHRWKYSSDIVKRCVSE